MAQHKTHGADTGLSSGTPSPPIRLAAAALGWLKVKPSHALDVVILASEWGTGAGAVGSQPLHLDARDPAGGFVMLGKTFKGLTDAMLASQTKHQVALPCGLPIRRIGPGGRDPIWLGSSINRTYRSTLG